MRRRCELRLSHFHNLIPEHWANVSLYPRRHIRLRMLVVLYPSVGVAESSNSARPGYKVLYDPEGKRTLVEVILVKLDLLRITHGDPREGLRCLAEMTVWYVLNSPLVGDGVVTSSVGESLITIIAA